MNRTWVYVFMNRVCCLLSVVEKPRSPSQHQKLHPESDNLLEMYVIHLARVSCTQIAHSLIVSEKCDFRFYCKTNTFTHCVSYIFGISLRKRLWRDLNTRNCCMGELVENKITSENNMIGTVCRCVRCAVAWTIHRMALNGKFTLILYNTLGRK